MTHYQFRQRLIHPLSTDIGQLTPKLIQTNPLRLVRLARGGNSARDMIHLRVIVDSTAGSDLLDSAKPKPTL